MIKLVLARHGQTDYNFGHRLQGQTDRPLNETGIKQAEEQGKYLSKINFDVLISSDLKRSAMAAKNHSKLTGLNINLDPNWRERDFGKHSETKLTDLGYQNPTYDDMVHHFYECDCPNGETKKQFEERLKKGLKELCEKYKDKKVMLHTHGGVIMFILNILFNKERTFENSIAHKNGFISYLEIEENLKVTKSHLSFPVSEIKEYF